MSELFPGFTTHRLTTSGATIHCVVGGSGPPLLLLHGYPQTHAIWHRVAPRLAERFTVVCSDLRGYGDSSKPEGGPKHIAYSKRAMAQDQVEVMQALGFPRFKLVGHDRGGRVAHRLCLDHPRAVERVAVLDISPTRAMYDGTDMAFATAYYHWFFLIQPFDLPERMIGADPIYYLRRKLGGWGSIFRISTLARSPSTSGASATRRRSMRRARTTAQRPRSISSTMRPTRTREWSARSSRCGAREASSIGCSIRSPTGRESPAMCEAGRCRRGTISPRKCPMRRWPSCWRSWDRAESCRRRREGPRLPRRSSGEGGAYPCYNIGLGRGVSGQNSSTQAK
jgi:pimeloyl-ACP methyl ester carboxylesterase